MRRRVKPAAEPGTTPAAGQQAGLMLDSVVDCQTVATVPRTEIVRRLGRFPPEVMRRIDRALEDSLGLAGDPAQKD